MRTGTERRDTEMTDTATNGTNDLHETTMRKIDTRGEGIAITTEILQLLMLSGIPLLIITTPAPAGGRALLHPITLGGITNLPLSHWLSFVFFFLVF